MIASFIRARPALLFDLPDDPMTAGHAWPSPRSWDRATRLGATAEAATLDDQAALDLLAGCVGEGPAVELLVWVAELDLPDPEEALAEPLGVDIPSRGGSPPRTAELGGRRRGRPTGTRTVGVGVGAVRSSGGGRRGRRGGRCRSLARSPRCARAHGPRRRRSMSSCRYCAQPVCSTGSEFNPRSRAGDAGRIDAATSSAVDGSTLEKRRFARATTSAADSSATNLSLDASDAKRPSILSSSPRVVSARLSSERSCRAGQLPASGRRRLVPRPRRGQVGSES